MHGNSNLHRAKRAQNDEFYTQLDDIQEELRHYIPHFRGKTILCNCDDPRQSNFYTYFATNFEYFGLKKLICTCYKSQDADLFSQGNCERALYLVYQGGLTPRGEADPEQVGLHPLRGDGDFRSPECRALLQEADIVCTNPPFSLFREFVAQLLELDKHFLIIGPKNAITYKEIFPHIKEGRLWLGYGFKNGNAFFKVPEARKGDFVQGVYDEKEGLVKFRNCCWFTNLDHPKRHEPLILDKHYTPEAYPTYDNYQAIEVSRVAEIPKDYPGVMGVPITFLDHFCPEQFELVGASESEGKGFSNGLWVSTSGVAQPLVARERVYKRIFIKKRED